jgi:hypothetical protein
MNMHHIETAPRTTIRVIFFKVSFLAIPLVEPRDHHTMYSGWDEKAASGRHFRRRPENVIENTDAILSRHAFGNLWKLLVGSENERDL